MSGFVWSIITAIIWGIVPMMEKIGLGQISPTLGVMIRSLGVVIGLLLFGWKFIPGSALEHLSWPSALLLMSGGLLASIVGQLAFYHALKSGAISQVTPVAGAYPLVAALLRWWLLHEPVTLPRVLGVFCVVVGVCLLRR